MVDPQLAATPLEREFLAANVLPHWQRRVRAADGTVRVYSPYLDDLVVQLLGDAEVLAEGLSVVTDLSPGSGALTYRRQLLAIRELLNQGVEVRSLPRLHAKVLLVDGTNVTVGSQNFTRYACRSKEATAIPALGMSESRFVARLERWYEEAEPVDLELIDRLLADLAEPLQTARAAINALKKAYAETLADYREAQRLSAQRRFERHLAQARTVSAAEAMRRAASASPYFTGQGTAFAHLRWLADGYWTLKADPDVNLLRWRRTDEAGRYVYREPLVRLKFYPFLLGPGMRMGYGRVAQTRISYVYRGLRWESPRTIFGRSIYAGINFPDEQTDGSNLILTFRWHPDIPGGYQMRLRFDGEQVLPVAEGALFGDSWRGNELAELIESAYEDSEVWNEVLRDVLSSADLHDFRDDKYAETFFPQHWLRINLVDFLGRAVLLIQPP